MGRVVGGGCSWRWTGGRGDGSRDEELGSKDEMQSNRGIVTVRWQDPGRLLQALWLEGRVTLKDGGSWCGAGGTNKESPSRGTSLFASS